MRIAADLPRGQKTGSGQDGGGSIGVPAYGQGRTVQLELGAVAAAQLT